MIKKDFILKSREFRRRKLSTIQHKLRILMKCYTVVDFDLDENNNSFVFKKTHKINGLKMSDPKEYNGKFDLKDLDDDMIILTLIVGDKLWV